MFASAVGAALRFAERHKIFASTLLALCILSAAVYGALFRPGASFPQNTIITIESGSSLRDVAHMLKEAGVVRSAFILRFYINVRGNERRIIAGDYLFKKPEGIPGIAKRITTGNFELEPVRITIPEGATITEIATLLGASLMSFPTEQFIAHAQGKEGMLFPDTYFFPPNVKPEDIIKKMEGTFRQKIATIQNDISRFGRPLQEVIIMASMLEKEAHTFETRRMIAGILWERLHIGMPLQVDATFLYINGKKTYELSIDDLAMDSTYNTYKYSGLPEGPIGNPSLEALHAAVTPIPSEYLYYLADKEGTTHYAKTFEDHKRNKELYIN